MNDLLNFKNLFIPTAIMLDSEWMMAQTSLVESTEMDSNYANTTVIYKAKASDDMLVLMSLGQNFSTGDKVRMAISDPKPSSTMPENADEDFVPNVVLPEKMSVQNDLTTPKMTLKDQKTVEKNRARGLRSPKPIPVKSTGKIYNPYKKSLLGNFPKINFPKINLGSGVRCPHF
jgi:hypothetical protein